MYISVEQWKMMIQFQIIQEKKKKKGDVRFFFNYESRTEEVGVQTYLSLQNLPSFIFQICFLFWPKLKKKKI